MDQNRTCPPLNCIQVMDAESAHPYHEGNEEVEGGGWKHFL